MIGKYNNYWEEKSLQFASQWTSSIIITSELQQMIAKSVDESQNQFHSFKLATLCFIVLLVLSLLSLHLFTEDAQSGPPSFYLFGWLFLLSTSLSVVFCCRTNGSRKQINWEHRLIFLSFDFVNLQMILLMRKCKLKGPPQLITAVIDFIINQPTTHRLSISSYKHNSVVLTSPVDD